MNAITDNPYARAWAEFGRNMAKPRAILAISAHWFVPRLAITAMDRPPTIHDFGGFPEPLASFRYPAPGDRNLVLRVKELLTPETVHEDSSWGYDHGTWGVLCRVYPEADVPVVQLSLDCRQPPEYHYDLGTKLAPLRDENVLIVGSGNIVHNLRLFTRGRPETPLFDGCRRFEDMVRKSVLSGDHRALIDYETMGPDAELAAPTAEHFLPLLYVVATQQSGEPAAIPIEGTAGGTISMLSVLVG